MSEVAKPSLARRIWEVCLHYYHGFRLLAMDIRVAVRLLRKTLRGVSLTRKERKQVCLLKQYNVHSSCIYIHVYVVS